MLFLTHSGWQQHCHCSRRETPQSGKTFHAAAYLKTRLIGVNRHVFGCTVYLLCSVAQEISG
jgi:hypothetical protein